MPDIGTPAHGRVVPEAGDHERLELRVAQPAEPSLERADAGHPVQLVDGAVHQVGVRVPSEAVHADRHASTAGGQPLRHSHGVGALL